MRTNISTILPGNALNKKPSDLQLVGTITKTDGSNGAVLIKLAADAPTDDVFEDEFIFALVDDGIVPLAIDSLTRRGERSATVHFANFSSPADSAYLVGCRVCLGPDATAEWADDADDAKDLIGFRAFDVKAGLLGEIIDLDLSVVANPLFIIRRNDASELLVPAVDAFIREINDDEHSLLLDLPDGLVNIDSVEEF